MCLMHQSKGNNGPPVKQMPMVKDDLEGGDGKLRTIEATGRLYPGKDHELGGKTFKECHCQKTLGYAPRLQGLEHMERMKFPNFRRKIESSEGHLEIDQTSNYRIAGA